MTENPRGTGTERSNRSVHGLLTTSEELHILWCQCCFSHHSEVRFVTGSFLFFKLHSETKTVVRKSIFFVVPVPVLTPPAVQHNGTGVTTTGQWHLYQSLAQYNDIVPPGWYWRGARQEIGDSPVSVQHHIPEAPELRGRAHGEECHQRDLGREHWAGLWTTPRKLPPAPPPPPPLYYYYYYQRLATGRLTWKFVVTFPPGSKRDLSLSSNLKLHLT